MVITSPPVIGARPSQSPEAAQSRPTPPTFRRASSDSTTPAQYQTWGEVFQTGRRALSAWEGKSGGGYPVQAPDLTQLRGVDPAKTPVWTVYKDPRDQSLTLSSLDFPRQSPCLSVTPSPTSWKPPVCMLDGKVLSEHSSLRDLQLARLLVETMEIAV